MRAASDADLTRRFGAIMDDALLIAETRGAFFPKGVKNQLRMGFAEVATERCRVHIEVAVQLPLHGLDAQPTDADFETARALWREVIEDQFVGVLQGMLKIGTVKGARFPYGLRSDVAKQWGGNAAEICVHAVDVARKATLEFAEDLPATVLSCAQSENDNNGG